MTARYKPLTALAVVAALSLGVVACTEAEQQQAERDAEVAGERIEQGAAELGERIEAGAMKAARGVEDMAGSAAERLENNQREAAAESRDGAVDPDTGERVE
ncbi:MAG: hypothetical protein ACK4FB_00405 [Brevundimonas sp.]|uniref:hypothetical protein n=1 Tax=Brevundimonas sp. TaxID=1871086 RepID=UPI00391B2AB4